MKQIEDLFTWMPVFGTIRKLRKVNDTKQKQTPERAEATAQKQTNVLLIAHKNNTDIESDTCILAQKEVDEWNSHRSLDLAAIGR